MDSNKQIEAFISRQDTRKQQDLIQLNQMIHKLMPAIKQVFFDGLNADGKLVANPTIGYGECTLNYADGTFKTTFRVGISANKTGISIYLIALKNQKEMLEQFRDKIGKAKLSAYCLRFKALKDLNLDVLKELFIYGVSDN